jgi:hypothetical protein
MKIRQRSIALRKSNWKDCSITNHNKWMEDPAKSLKLDYEQLREPCWPGLRESIRSFAFPNVCGSRITYVFKEISQNQITAEAEPVYMSLPMAERTYTYIDIGNGRYYCINRFTQKRKFALQAPHDRKSESYLLECIQMEQRIENCIKATINGCKKLYTDNPTLTNVWSGREHTHPRPNLPNEWEKIQIGEDVLIHAPMPLFDDQQLFNTKGHRLLEKWKRTSGRSKTWRRCQRAKASQQSPCLKATSPANFGGCQFFVSPLWIPSTLLRIEQKVPPLRVKRLARSPKAKEKCIWRDTQVMDGRNQVKDSWVTHNFPQREYSPEKGSDQWAAVQSHTKPSAVFIRFTWKDMILVKGSGVLDRFFPTGLVLHSCWRVEHFLRNDPHADVYRASNIQQRSRLCLEAHIFLDEYHFNCKTFAKRHKHRLEQSGNCAAKFWYQGRHILVMTVPVHFECFKLKNNEKEYPSLKNQGKGSKKAVMSRSFHDKPTYAATVRKGIAEQRAANRLQDMRLGKVNETVLDTWMDQELGLREKKAKKQRDKRQMQRGMKRAEKDIEGLIYTLPHF